MTTNTWRKIAVWVFACALFAVIVGILISFLCPVDVKVVNLPDKSVEFKFAVITQGTNHVIFIGNPVVARLRWWGFCHPRLRPLCKRFPASIKADWFVTKTDASKRVLWVGFGDPEPLFLHSSMTNSIGSGVELRSVRFMQSSSRPRAIGVNLQAFELPVARDQLKGRTVRVYGLGTFEQENELATLQLQ